ncbi:MAG: ABC transporter ATP-binding protein [Gammaproteobacteria bacterium]|nr:ABC transporter ATP-binding protein [Gammaproteobacteria bacterium]
MSNIIQIANVTKTYSGDITAVDNLSLEVREGEFVTFLGPSGCGKTTILRMIAGFEIPTVGNIFLAGEDVTERPPYERQVNTVFQDYALFPHMNIRENVGYGLRVAGMPRTEIKPAVEEALATVGLEDKAEARPGNLSGGQKQRVALARAMVRKPKVLLLDEPLSALDAKLREAMQVELKHLHEQLGITFVFVTHDQKEALVMSDRVVVMEKGRIVQSGTPAELYDHPVTPYVADFIGNSNKLYGRVISADADQVSMQVGDAIVQSTPGQTRYAPGDEVLASIRPEKVRLLAEDEDAGNCSIVPGTVREILFHGSSYRMEIDIGQLQMFDVDVQLELALATSNIHNPGTSVRLALNPEMVSVFPVAEDNV